MALTARAITVTSAASLGIAAWAILLVGFGFTYLFVPDTYATSLSIMTSRTASQLLVANVAWWFTLVGLPLALASLVVAPRVRMTWVALVTNAAFWILLWGFMYGDVAPRSHALYQHAAHGRARECRAFAELAGRARRWAWTLDGDRGGSHVRWALWTELCS